MNVFQADKIMLINMMTVYCTLEYKVKHFMQLVISWLCKINCTSFQKINVSEIWDLQNSEYTPVFVVILSMCGHNDATKEQLGCSH